MKRLARLLCMVFILIQAGFASAAAGTDAPKPKYGPAGTPYATPLWQSHEYLQSTRNAAPDFWKLISHYDGQNNSLSCSVAAVAIVLNAIERSRADLRASDANFLQGKLIDDVRDANWKERVTDGGWKGRAGLTLAELEDVVRGTLKTYGIKGWAASSRSFKSAGSGDLAELRAILEVNEASADDFVIIHFLQDRLTDDPGGPYAHISPIGAYDATSGRVLVLDVDREYYGPYWVKLEQLLIAVSASTPTYGHGGVLIVRRVSR
jgi:hypothetical protein